MQLSARHQATAWAALFSILAVVFLWSRLLGLDLSLWHDEVVTVTRYAGQGPNAIFFGDYIPNNHVFFEILAWATTSLLGTTEVLYRLWGVIPALAAGIWLVWWALQRFGRLVAAMVGVLTVVSPLLFQLAREARGYGLAMLAMVGLVTQADSALRDPQGGGVWRFCGFGLLGVLTLPAFVMPFVFMAIPLIVHRDLRRRALVGVGSAGLVALVWFSPMIVEILEHSSQQYGHPVPWHGFATLSMRNLLFPIVRLLMPGTPDIMLSNPRDGFMTLVMWHAVAWPVMFLGARRLWRRGNRFLLASLVAAVVGTYLTMAAQGMWVVDRFVSYLSFPIFILIGLGIGQLVGYVKSTWRSAASVVLASVVTLWMLVSYMPVANHVLHVPHEALKEAGELANVSGATRVVSNSARPEGLVYYLDAAPEVMAAESLEHLFCDSRSEAFVFIDHPFSSETVDTTCLKERGSPQVILFQRGRGRHIDVWFVDVRMAVRMITPFG